MEIGRNYRIRTSVPVLNVKDFSKDLYNDPELDRLTASSFFYFIVQRPIHYFDNVILKDHILSFKVRQESNPFELECHLPLFQSNLFSSDIVKYNVQYQSENSTLHDTNGNLTGIHSIKLFKGEIKQENFLKLFLPEWLFFDYFNGLIEMSLKGDLDKFQIYNIHYIGTALEQPITQRLIAHSKLQKILSEVEPITNSLPALEMGLMFFELDRISKNILIQPGSNQDSILKLIMDRTVPTDKKIFKDAEKAFISSMKPKFNEIQFKSYPNKSALINEADHDILTYEILNPMQLNFANGVFKSINGDLILINTNERPIIINYEN